MKASEHLALCESKRGGATAEERALRPRGRREEMTGRDIHREWRDGMLAQGRYVSPKRKKWETLTEQDRELDERIAQSLSKPVEAKVEAGELLHQIEMALEDWKQHGHRGRREAAQWILEKSRPAPADAAKRGGATEEERVLCSELELQERSTNIAMRVANSLGAKLEAAEERCKRLVKTIRLAYNALDSMMGDTDLGEDDSEEMKAMQAMSKIIAEEEARDE